MNPTTSPEERRAQALQLHLAGVSYELIAQKLGYRGKSGAHKAVQVALKSAADRTEQDDADVTELARLDTMLSGLWTKARRGDLGAIDRVLRIEERRAQIKLRIATSRPPTSSEDSSASDEVARAREARDRKARQAAGGA